MKSPLAATLGGLVLWLGGCATTSPDGQTTRAAENPSVASDAVVLPRGASGATVLKALGKPQTIEPVPENPAAAIWTYRRRVGRTVRVVEPAMQDTPVFDGTNRATGMVTVQVPVQYTQEIAIEEVLVLIIVNDQLREWHRSYREVVADQAIR